MQSKRFTSSRIEEIKKKKRKIFKRRIIFSFIVFLILLITFGFISNWNKINISKIEISGNKIIESKDIEKFIKEEISGNYLFIYSKSNVLFLPQREIKESLYKNYRRIEDIKFDLGDLETLKVSITERVPLYTWCGQSLKENNLKGEEERCEFMDINGYVFDVAPYFSGDVYFRFYGPLSEYYFGGKYFNNFILFKNNLDTLNIKPSSLVMKDNNESEIYLSSNVLPPLAPKIIFNNDSDLEKIYQNLESAIKTDPLKSDFKNKYFSLEYLDLRFNNKVYYKFK